MAINRNGHAGVFKGVDVYRVSPVQYICRKLYNDNNCIYAIEDQKILIRGNIVFATLGEEGRVIELEPNQQYKFYNPNSQWEVKIDEKDVVAKVPEIVKETGIELEPQLTVDDLLEGVYKWQL